MSSFISEFLGKNLGAVQLKAIIRRRLKLGRRAALLITCLHCWTSSKIWLCRSHSSGVGPPRSQLFGLWHNLEKSSLLCVVCCCNIYNSQFQYSFSTEFFLMNLLFPLLLSKIRNDFSLQFVRWRPKHVFIVAVCGACLCLICLSYFFLKFAVENWCQ